MIKCVVTKKYTNDQLLLEGRNLGTKMTPPRLSFTKEIKKAASEIGEKKN